MKTSLPSASEKEVLTAALNANLPKVVPPLPLATPSQATPPVEVQGTATPSIDASSEQAPSYAVYPNDGYNCDGRYGGHLQTCYNSSQVDDCEHLARANFCYQQANCRPNPAPGICGPLLGCL
jgi:hypothetical protein